MDALRLSYPACVLAGQKIIDAQDIVFLRKYAFPNGLADASDALALVEIHRSASTKCKDWDAWFVEMMAAFIVRDCWPQGSLDEINADWIIGIISRNDVVESPAELDFLIHAIELAASVPDFLSAFAIDQVRIALEANIGAYAVLRQAKRQGIAQEDVDFIGRILKGACKNGQLHLTRRENAVLKAINRLVCDRLNHPGWRNMLAVVRENGVTRVRSSESWLKITIEEDVRPTLVA